MSKRFGFTLAEVLITLGIIGVVAAMTIPTLIQDYNTRVWNTSAKVFERKLEEALKTMNTQQTLAGHSTTESFVEELSKHFKTNKICQNDELLDCFSETVYWGGGEATPEEVDMNDIKKAKNFGQDDWDTNIVSVLFANGVSAMIAYNPTASCTQDPYSNQVTGGDCLAILYDTSANKNPNTSGKDLRANGNVTKLGKGCAFKIDGHCFGFPFTPTPLTSYECQTRKSELGIKTCYYADDYWAGTVATCGHVSKLPTLEQLASIGNYVYNVSNISAENSVNDLYLDTEKVLSLGFELQSNSFHIWSREENGNYYAAYRIYYPYSTSKATTSRNDVTNTIRQGICLID